MPRSCKRKKQAGPRAKVVELAKGTEEEDEKKALEAKMEEALEAWKTAKRELRKKGAKVNDDEAPVEELSSTPIPLPFVAALPEAPPSPPHFVSFGDLNCETLTASCSPVKAPELRAAKKPILDLKDLLNVCTELGPTVGAKPESSEADRALLKAAISDFCGESTRLNPYLRDAVAQLKGIDRAGTDPDLRDLNMEALDVLTDAAEDHATANRCIDDGVLLACNLCLDSPFPEIRASACTLIAELVHMNAYAREVCMGPMQVMPWLVAVVNAAGEEDCVKIKALYALSCYLRANVPGIQDFLDSPGLSWIMYLAIGHAWDDINILRKCKNIISSIYTCDSEDLKKKYLKVSSRNTNSELWQGLHDQLKIPSVKKLDVNDCAVRSAILQIFYAAMAGYTDELWHYFIRAQIDLVNTILHCLWDIHHDVDQEVQESPEFFEFQEVVLDFKLMFNIADSYKNRKPSLKKVPTK